MEGDLRSSSSDISDSSENASRPIANGTPKKKVQHNNLNNSNSAIPTSNSSEQQ